MNALLHGLLLSTLLATAPAWQGQILSDSPAVRNAAVARLRAKGRPGLYALQDLVAQSTSSETRAQALRALGEFGDPAAEWALRGELKRPSAEVAAAAIRAAASLRLRALERLAAARVGDPDPRLCQALGESAAVFPAVVVAALVDLASPSVAFELSGLRVLQGAHAAVPEASARALLASGAPEVRLLAAQALAPKDPEAAGTVFAALASGTGDAVAVAMTDMARLGQPRLIADLEAIARGPSKPRSELAIAALIGSPAGLAALLAVRGGTRASRDEVDSALAAHPPTTSDLMAVIRGGTKTASAEAAELLAGHPEGASALAGCLRDLGATADRCALGLARNPAAAKTLAELLESVDPHIRAIAALAMAAAPERPRFGTLAPLMVDPAPQVRAAAALGLGRLGAPALPPLLTLVHDPNGQVRSAAASQLASLLPVDELVRLVAQTLDDDAVRPELATAVARLPAQAAVSLLLAVLRRGGGEERRRAVEALARFSDPRAFDALARVASRDPDPAARLLAANLLGN